MSVEEFNRRELDNQGAIFHEDVVVHMVEDWPEPVVRGAANYVDWMRGWFDAVGNDLRLEEMVCSGELMAFHLRIRMHGGASAVEQDGEFSTVYLFNRGKVVTVIHFREFADALAAIGRA
jgi:hypothetical protein